MDSNSQQTRTDTLEIKLLGPLLVLRGGQALPDSAWRSRQARRLLAILLAARGATLPGARLSAWLWPEADRVAAATLRSAVSGLRQALEPGARASSRYILTRPGGYAWNAGGGAQVDLDDFLALLDEQRPPDQVGQQTDWRAQRLEQARALYRGDFLADEPEAPWASALRETLRERFLGALHELAELRLAGGAYAEAARLARHGLAHDQLREPLYRALMQAQARAGDISGALQSYERCRRALDDELGATPSLQTRALHAAILRGAEGSYGAPAGPNAGSEARRAGAIFQAHLPVFDAAPFVGRANELAALRDWIAALDQHRGGVAVIVGEAGIGKTRLVAEALRTSAGLGLFTIALRCSPLERGLPFAPLSEALRPLLRAVPLETLARLPEAALAQVADLLPVLRERLPKLPILHPAPAEGHNHLLDGLVDLALALAHDHPLIVWCDDAQWADEATLAALGRLARRAPRHALLLLLAYRSEELLDNAALHALLRSLNREALPRPLALGRLDDRDVAQYLAALAHVAPEQVAFLAPRLSVSSDGNPLFLSLAVQSLLESRGVQSLAALLPRLGDVQLPDLAGMPLLRDLLLARLERLPAPARALLEQLAVLGRAVSLDLIEQLSGPAGLDAARVLLERQLLSEAADRRLTFQHDLLRSATVAALSSPQRRLLHRRAAEAIAALYGDRPERAAELAFHFEQSGHGAEAQVLGYAAAAGDHARSSFGYRLAREHYDRALRAAERLGAQASAAATRHAFAGRLLMDEALLDWDGIMETAGRYERWAAGSGLPPLVTTRRLVMLRALMGDLAGAAALSVEQLRGQPESPVALDDMLWRTAIILQPIEAITRVGRPGSHEVPASSLPPLAAFSTPHPLPGAPAEDLPALLEADEAALALFQVGWAALMQGMLGDAEPCLLRAHALALETSQAGVAVISALQLAHLHALWGDVSASERWMAASLDAARQASEASWALIWPRIHQAFLLLLDGQHAAARERFDQMAAQLYDLPAFQSHRASVEVGLGLLDLLIGDSIHAAERLERALASPQLLYGFVYMAAQQGQARIAAQRGELQDARAILAHALSYSARRSLLPEYVRAAIEIARIERDYGDPAPVLPLLRAAAELARAAGLIPLATAAESLLARCSH